MHAEMRAAHDPPNLLRQNGFLTKLLSAYSKSAPVCLRLSRQPLSFPFPVLAHPPAPCPLTPRSSSRAGLLRLEAEGTDAGRAR